MARTPYWGPPSARARFGVSGWPLWAKKKFESRRITRIIMIIMNTQCFLEVRPKFALVFFSSTVPGLSHPIMIWLQLFWWRSRSPTKPLICMMANFLLLKVDKNWLKSLAETGWKKSKVNSNLLRREKSAICVFVPTSEQQKRRKKGDPILKGIVIAFLVQIKDEKKIGHDFRRPIECANHKRKSRARAKILRKMSQLFFRFLAVLYSQFVIQKGESGCV